MLCTDGDKSERGWSSLLKKIWRGQNSSGSNRSNRKRKRVRRKRRHSGKQKSGLAGKQRSALEDLIRAIDDELTKNREGE